MPTRTVRRGLIGAQTIVAAIGAASAHKLVRRTIPAIFVVSALAIATPKSATAHARLDHASPKAGSTIATAPNQVVLTFTEKLEPAFSSIEVRNAKGAEVQAGKTRAGADRTQLRVPLKALPPGTYTVIWRALSVDTHRSQGTFTFTVGR